MEKISKTKRVSIELVVFFILAIVIVSLNAKGYLERKAISQAEPPLSRSFDVKVEPQQVPPPPMASSAPEEYQSSDDSSQSEAYGSIAPGEDDSILLESRDGRYKVRIRIENESEDPMTVESINGDKQEVASPN
jgi:hypothetical protein